MEQNGIEADDVGFAILFGFENFPPKRPTFEGDQQYHFYADISTMDCKISFRKLKIFTSCTTMFLQPRRDRAIKVVLRSIAVRNIAAVHQSTKARELVV
jgi:hypothetical protein